MDIQQWLAATTGRGTSPPLDDHAHSRSYRRKKRKRASSDSIIAPRDPRVRLPPHSLPSERARSADHAESSPATSAYSSPHAPESPGAPPTKTYERRRRHKTRPDRYHPKKRKRKGDQDARKEKKSGSKRRKSHRSADGGRTAGLVQSFQLKNGRKNSRLTMKPTATAGLFRHGRASAQVTGRGAGLPDLVFNEMRFLQRPAEHQDAPIEAQEERERSKNSHKRLNDGEMSAYFDTKQPAHDQQAGHRDPPQSLERPSKVDRAVLLATRRRRRITPPIELPSKPFLEFGSKRGQTKSKEVHSEHTSYLSWSETPPPRPSIVQRRPAITTADDANALSHSKSERLPKGHRPVLFRRRQEGHGENDSEAQSIAKRSISRHGEWVQTRTGNDAARVEICQPPTNQARDTTEECRPTAKTTSQSLPRGFVERQSADQTHDRYHTSDILKVHEDGATSNLPNSDAPKITRASGVEKENQDPTSSLFIDRLLNTARYVTDISLVETRQTAPEQDRECRRNMDHEQISGPGDTDPPLSVRGEMNQRLRQRSRPSSLMDQPEAFNHGSHQELYVAQPSRRDGGEQRPPIDYGAVTLPVQPPIFDDDEMLDDGRELGSHLWLHEPVYASRQQAEDLAYGSRLRTTSGIYEAQSELLASEATTLWRTHEQTPSNTVLPRSISIGRTIASELLGGSPSGDTVDGMTGFWKPYRLY